MDSSLGVIAFLEDLALDREKRSQFLIDPDGVLMSYVLTQNEIATLRLLADDAYGHSERGLRNLAKMLQGLAAIRGEVATAEMV